MNKDRQINIRITDRVYDKLSPMANAAGVPPSTYVRLLFEAAYAARHAPTGDAALDRNVACLMLLHRLGATAQDISGVLTLDPEIIAVCLDAWREELRRELTPSEPEAA